MLIDFLFSTRNPTSPSSLKVLLQLNLSQPTGQPICSHVLSRFLNIQLVLIYFNCTGEKRCLRLHCL